MSKISNVQGDQKSNQAHLKVVLSHEEAELRLCANSAASAAAVPAQVTQL